MLKGNTKQEDNNIDSCLETAQILALPS